MSVDADVIVAGGGPAGAAAAFHLASAGIDVLVLERGRFPRDKVCGDFVGPVALAELEAMGLGRDPAIVDSNVCDRAALFADGQELITYVLPEREALPSYGRVVPRIVLDAALARAAQRAGARLREGLTVQRFASHPDGIDVIAANGTAHETLRAKVLVGADGSGSLVGRCLHGRPRPRDEFLVAVRGYFEGVAGLAQRCDLSFVSDSFPGYAWVFPTAEGRANVGVGMVAQTFPEGKEQMRTLLADLVRRDPAMRARLEGARVAGDVAGWPLATFAGRTSPVGDRVVLAGDAAGLVNPLNGEGIQAALCSGRWAAQTIAPALVAGDVSAAGLATYDERLQSELGYDMLLARLIVRFIANRRLNPIWLPMLRAIVSRAACDGAYAHATGGVVAGIVPVREAFATGMLLRTAASVAGRIAASVGAARRGGSAAARDMLGRALSPLAELVAAPEETLHWVRSIAETVQAIAAVRAVTKKESCASTTQGYS